MLQRYGYTCLWLICLFLSPASLAKNAPTPEPMWFNDGYNNRDLTISPDGKTLLTSILSAKNKLGVILVMTYSDGQWSDAEIAPFSGKYPDIEPMFSPDGKKVWFASRRPLESTTQIAYQDALDPLPVKDWDIWYVTFNDGEFGAPVNPGHPLNTSHNEFYPSVTQKGNLYFTSDRNGGFGKEDLYRLTPDNNIENLGAMINTEDYEFNAFIDPNETFIIYTAMGRDGSLGRGDLYINTSDDSGRFGEPIHLKDGINSPQLDYCPFVYDGFLYFTSERYLGSKDIDNITQLRQRLNQPGNGLGDIFKIAFDPDKL
ncbi:MAG: hypothetical protein OEZ23_00625 [Gammaproteobacteria bacterium]|nr:hypothetical protein [Gammaproteobacteria bacterium]